MTDWFDPKHLCRFGSRSQALPIAASRDRQRQTETDRQTDRQRGETNRTQKRRNGDNHVYFMLVFILRLFSGWFEHRAANSIKFTLYLTCKVFCFLVSCLFAFFVVSLCFVT